MTCAEARAVEILEEVEKLTRTFITATAPLPPGEAEPPKRDRPRRRSCAYNCLNVDLSFDIRCLAQDAPQPQTSEPSFSVIRVDHSATSASTGRVVRVVITNVPEGSPLHILLLELHDRLLERIQAIDSEGVAVQKEVCWLLHQRKRAAVTLTERMTFEILYMFFEDAAG
jgi:hypothetical protein